MRVISSIESQSSSKSGLSATSRTTIVETALPGTSDTFEGLKEGSYWQSIATKYENGVPGSRLVKAIYNVWRSKYFVDLVTKTLEGKVRISACCYVFMAASVMGLIG